MPIIQSVERALEILDLFDEQTTELKITEISQRMELHKSTVHSLLKTLMKNGYIAQNIDSGKYKLGLKLLERGQLLLQSLDVRAVAHDNLLSLSANTGQTTHLVILNDGHGVYIDKIEGEKAAIRYSRLGRRIPLHCSAAGKALIAFQSEARREQLLLGYTFTSHTPNTIMNSSKFVEEITQVRKQGFAVDNQENEPGVRCAASPIFDHTGQVVATISLSTMITSVGDEEFEQYIAMVKAESSVISQLLGYRDQV